MVNKAINASFYLSSMKSEVELEGKKNNNAADNLADAMIASLANDMGIQLPKANISFTGSSHRGSINRHGASPATAKNKSSSAMIVKRPNFLPSLDDESEIPESGRTNQTNLQVKATQSQELTN